MKSPTKNKNIRKNNKDQHDRVNFENSDTE